VYARGQQAPHFTAFLVDGRRCAAKRREHDSELLPLYEARGGGCLVAVSGPVRVKTRKDLRNQRRPGAHSCWDHLIAAPLWPMHGANLGTLLRTCDAVGACLAVPRLPWVPLALDRGNTLRRPVCVHYIGDPSAWLSAQRAAGSAIVGAELADEAVRLADLPAARRRTVLVLGHEHDGIPPDALGLLDVAVEIPMVGHGGSLNVAVAGSLVLYRLAGLL
jgi:tRNA (guanosine-2'-O-)-methyltransferase